MICIDNSYYQRFFLVLQQNQTKSALLKPEFNIRKYRKDIAVCLATYHSQKVLTQTPTKILQSVMYAHVVIMTHSLETHSFKIYD